MMKKLSLLFVLLLPCDGAGVMYFGHETKKRLTTTETVILGAIGLAIVCGVGNLAYNKYVVPGGSGGGGGTGNTTQDAGTNTNLDNANTSTTQGSNASTDTNNTNITKPGNVKLKWKFGVLPYYAEEENVSSASTSNVKNTSKSLLEDIKGKDTEDV
jgi:hypothetical protein